MIWLWLAVLLAFVFGCRAGWETAMWYIGWGVGGSVRRMAKQRKDEKSTDIIHVRLTPQETKALDKARGKRTRSDYIREKIQ